MYKIPKNIDLDILKDDEIHQISFGTNFISLFFEVGNIQFTGGFSLRSTSSNEIIDRDEVYPLHNDHGLLKLLGVKITGIDINKERTEIVLSFANGSSLRLKNSDQYESYTLNFKGINIVV